MRLYLSIWGTVFTGFGWWLLELGSPLVFGHNFGMPLEVNSGRPFSLEIDVLSTFWNFLGTCWAAIWYLGISDGQLYLDDLEGFLGAHFH